MFAWSGSVPYLNLIFGGWSIQDWASTVLSFWLLSAIHLDARMPWSVRWIVVYEAGRREEILFCVKMSVRIFSAKAIEDTGNHARARCP